MIAFHIKKRITMHKINVIVVCLYSEFYKVPMCVIIDENLTLMQYPKRFYEILLC